MKIMIFFIDIDMNNENTMPAYQQKWRNNQSEALRIAPNLDPCHKQHNIRWSPEKTGIVVGGFSIYPVLSAFPQYFFNHNFDSLYFESICHLSKAVSHATM